MPIPTPANGERLMRMFGDTYNAIDKNWNNAVKKYPIVKKIDRFMTPSKYSDFNIEPLDVGSSAAAWLAGGPVFKKPILAVKQTPLSAATRAAKETKKAELARADLVKSNQISLAQYLRRIWNERGINTPASHRKAMMKAVEINPTTVTPPPVGEYKLPYQSGAQVWEGAPLSEWFELSSEGILPHGPNSLWRKWEAPLKQASESFDILGQRPRRGAPAYSTTMSKLSEGLEAMAPYVLELKKQGGVVSAKSGIHIKKANRGKFTEYCGGKVTSECIARGKASSNPAIRKRATFAANARKWKHESGGKFIPYWIHNILGGK